jgi:plasmid stabilization system protein ParE
LNRKLHYLAPARRDLADIQRHLTKESGSVAISEAFVMRIRQKCQKLANLPGTLGQSRSELGDGLRSTAHRNYIIFFRYDDSTVQIVNVIEAHRDIAAHFRD